MPDKILTCSDCGQQFTFTEEDQEFYQTRGFSEPKRCRSCRAARRNEREGATGGAGAATGVGMDRPPRQDRELFDVVCSSCGQPTKVPFQPRGDRPVYCRDCFERMGGGANRSGGAGNRSSGGYGGARTGGGGGRY